MHHPFGSRLPGRTHEHQMRRGGGRDGAVTVDPKETCLIAMLLVLAPIMNGDHRHTVLVIGVELAKGHIEDEARDEVRRHQERPFEPKLHRVFREAHPKVLVVDMPIVDRLRVMLGAHGVAGVTREDERRRMAAREVGRILEAQRLRRVGVHESHVEAIASPARGAAGAPRRWCRRS